MNNTKNTDKLIEEAQSKEVLSFGLQSGRCGIVKGNGDLLISTGDKEVRVGYFEKNDETIKWTGYHFMYEPDSGKFQGYYSLYDPRHSALEQRIMDCDEKEAENLSEFAVKLGRFFDSRVDNSNHPINDLATQLVEAGLRNLYVSR